MKKRLIILLTVFALLVPAFCVNAQSTELVNVAIYQMAEASTEVSGHGSELANDGINDNADYTYFKSADGDEKPFWQVDLGVSYKLTKIEFEPRKNAEDGERKNFKIIASETADFNNPQILGEAKEDIGEIYTLDITKKVRFRYIKVEKTDSSPLSIGEIRVFVKKGDVLQGTDTVNISGQIPASDEEGRYILPSDVYGTPYEKAVSLLSALNIMRGYPDGDFLPFEAITRGEFTAVAMRLLKGKVTPGTRSFVDVPVEHWAYSYIETAANLGIVNGVGNEMFMPDSAVKTSQVIKILVSVLGYGKAAESMGGYPDGYMNIASKIGLFEDVKIENGENITRGEIATIVYNALSADVMTQTAFGDNASVTAIKGETVLKKNLGVLKDKGIVTAAANTSLTKVTSKKDSTYIEIDGVEFISDIPNLVSYLGYNVDYYYEDSDDNIKKIVALIFQSKNETLKIDASELVKIDNNTLYYGIEDEETISLSADMDVIYNGVCLSIYDKTTDLLPKNGSVILIDNDADGEIDVYIVSKIDNYVVNWVNAKKYQVYSKNVSKVLNLDPTESEITIVNKSTGKEMELANVLEWNILSVMESRNESGKKHLSVIVSDELVRGRYTEKGKDYVKVDDRTFKTADCFQKDSVELGAKGIFYLDAENKIAAFNGDSQPGEKYGFLRAAGADNENIELSLKLRIFTDEGKFETFYAKDDVYIDGKPYTDPQTAEEYLIAGGLEGTAAQAILYNVDAKGMIDRIETVRGSLSKDFDALANEPAPKSSGKGYYYTTAGTFDAIFSVDSETVMIELPTRDLAVEKDYKLLTSAGVKAGNYYYVQAYDAGEERLAKLVVFTGGASGGASESTMFFLSEGIMESVNEDGDKLYLIEGLYQGEKKSFFIDEDVNVNVSDFEAGNVLTLAKTGEIVTDYELKFYKGDKPIDAPSASVSENTPQYSRNIQGMMGTLWLGYGTVETKKNGMVRITFENTDVLTPGSSTDFVNYEEVVVNLANLQRIYWFDSVKEKVHVVDSSYVLDKATVGELDASKVLLRADSGNFIEMIILN